MEYNTKHGFLGKDETIMKIEIMEYNPDGTVANSRW